MASSSSSRRQPPLRPSSTANRSARGAEKRNNTPGFLTDANDDEYSLASGRQVPHSYLVKLIKRSKTNGILNLASRGLTEGKLIVQMIMFKNEYFVNHFFFFFFYLVPSEIFLDELPEDENQQRQKAKVPDFSQNNTETWWTREPLKTLDLSSNSLTTLPQEVETLNYLVVLNVGIVFFLFLISL